MFWQPYYYGGSPFFTVSPPDSALGLATQPRSDLKALQLVHERVVDTVAGAASKVGVPRTVSDDSGCICASTSEVPKFSVWVPVLPLRWVRNW